MSTASGLEPLAARVVSSATRIADVGPLPLESGAQLDAVRLAYRTWGELSPAGDNAVLICHALTGSADVDAWWAGLFDHALDLEHDFVIASNVLGGCYGSTGPASPRSAEPSTETDATPWGPDFPSVTIRDMVRAQARLLTQLGVRRLRLVIGGSMGGMQALEWPLLFPERVDAIAAIAVGAAHSAWCIGWSEAQRRALAADPAWNGGRYTTPPRAGLAAARTAALLTYRSAESFERRFGRRVEPTHSPDAADERFSVESYLAHQGEKLVDRFDANTYVTLTRAMDSHDLGRGRGGVAKALARVHQPVLVVSIPSDALYVPAEQHALASALPAGRLVHLPSDDGHDAFLIEVEALARHLDTFRHHLQEAA